MDNSSANTLWKVVTVGTNEFEYCSPPESMNVERGDHLIIQTCYGRDMVRVVGPVPHPTPEEQESIRTVERMANDEDFVSRKRIESREQEAYTVFRSNIETLGLQMNPVSAHFLIEEQKLLLFFTAEKRVDFRKLVKMLSSRYKIRVELRQVGVRDRSRIIGGLGVCGREFCCHGMTDKVPPVSIKMVKDQNISPNSTKISGSCGRLMCCLNYEHSCYIKKFKENNKFFRYTESKGVSL